MKEDRALSSFVKNVRLVRRTLKKNNNNDAFRQWVVT